MRRILLIGIILHPVLIAGQAIGQSTSMGNSGLGGGSLGSGSGGGLSGGGLGGGGLSSGGGMGGGGGSQFLGSPSGSGFGLGFMTLGQSNQGRGGSGTSTGSSSFLGPYFASPLALGYGPLNAGNAQAASSNSNPVFGTAFANTETSGGTGGRNTTGRGGAAGSASNLTASVDFTPVNSSGQRRNLPYAASISFEGESAMSSQQEAAMIAISERRLAGEVAAVVARSSRLPGSAGVSVSVEKGEVVLRGNVGTDKDRRVLEAMVRMTPGAREIRNEVRVGR